MTGRPNIFQQSPKSAEVLGTHKQGWFSEYGQKDLMEVANAPLNTNHNFEDMYVCDPNAKHFGYTSWDGRWFLAFIPLYN